MGKQAFTEPCSLMIHCVTAIMFCRGIQQVEAPGGRKPDLSTANVDLEAGTKAQGEATCCMGRICRLCMQGRAVSRNCGRGVFLNHLVCPDKVFFAS